MMAVTPGRTRPPLGGASALSFDGGSGPPETERIMGMFGRKAAGWPAEGVFTDDERERIDALWRLTALPREEFEATYGDMLAGFWRCIAKAAGVEWIVLRDEALASVLAALKVRQARIVPRFAPVEDAARLAEVMSFALAACVVSERFALVLGRAAAPRWSPLDGGVPAEAALSDVAVPRAFGALVLARMVGPAGHEWLAQEREALWETVAYFGAGRSELREIAREAADRIGRPLAGAEPPAPARQDTTARPASSPDPGPGKADEPQNDARARAVVGQANEPTDGAPAAVGGVGKGWEWINWVRAGVRDGSIAVNAAGGWLHNVAGRAFVVVPDGFEAYPAEDGVNAKTVRNRVTRLGKHRQRKAGNRAVDEFRAQLGDGRREAGMVFPGELIWEDRPPPALESELEGRSR